MLFILFISFTVLAMLNVITGVFCEQARENSAKDSENVLMEHIQKKETLTKDIIELFLELDKDDTGTVSYAEFHSFLMDEDTKNHFELPDLQPWDALILFDLLDHDDNGKVDVEEFVNGCFQLRGTARMVDM